ncbi:hypothetical protein [Streptomyces griseocarneus]|uniref:hypothetical protein n=1 Tax=Streptomyces griseocarneus TaxID=51201 RepID=UPI00167CE7BF|nr:hypothetical protein [Streptomyces griseocarneus]MBZ6473336.1 hypothetical protein [Streptomyces griseocarneus]GHG57502.1 hypothetical protein GCM10018779_22600 [Streptomyces griseocarneus]
MTTSLRPGNAAPNPVGIAGETAGDAAPGEGQAPGEGGAHEERTPADPVKALLRRHHALCADAVDPLEIAAGLEARGVGDRVAAEYRHRDVFSLAEELHARVERGQEADRTPEPGTPGPGGGPCAVLLGGWGTTGSLAWLWLVAYGLVGDCLVGLLLHGRGGLAPQALVSAAVTAAAPTALALACSVAPAAWCAHWFAGRARRVLGASRGLAEFGRRVRPALLVTVALFVGALLAFLWPARTALPAGPSPAGPAAGPLLAYTAVAALGGLFFLARLLAAHGLARPAVAATLAAAVAEAVPLGALLAARLPGCEALRRPVGWAADAYGPAAIPLVACALPALALLAHAFPALSRASVHGRGDLPHVPTPASPLGAPPVPKA